MSLSVAPTSRAFLDEPSPAKLRVREDRLERCSRGSSSDFESNNIVSDLNHMYCGEERRRASLLYVPSTSLIAANISAIAYGN
jgi:hypothetical protein